MTPTETATILRQFNEWRRGDEDIPQPDPREIGEAIDAAIAMIDRLEAAEKDNALKEKLIDRLALELNSASFKRDALRARIEAMEQQEPICITTRAHLDAMENGAVRSIVGRDPVFATRGPNDIPLYALPGAQPAPSGEDDAVRKAWARFSNELHRSPDAPYPGMSDAFEQHFSQSFTDREWRAESATWAAAWKAAKRHEAQAQPAPSVPDGWLKHAAHMATLAKKLREPDWCLESIREMQRELRTLEEAALAAAPGEAT